MKKSKWMSQKTLKTLKIQIFGPLFGCNFIDL